MTGQVTAGTADGTLDEIFGRIAPEARNLMAIAQAAQQRLGHLSDATIEGIAARLHVPPVDVRDMVSFYAFLNLSPKGRFHIRLSRSPVSLIKGAQAVADAFAAAIGVAMGETSADGHFTLDWTSDIGMADQEPAALINGTVVTRLEPADAAPIVAALRQRDGANSLPLFPGGDAAGAALPKAVVASGLELRGPVLLGAAAADGQGLRAALDLAPEEVIREVTRSRLRGRGGAGFPTGMKWKLCRQAPGAAHHLLCNADEGEPGTFKDRLLLAEFPDLVFEGMTIAGYAIGATEGLIYLRGEYAYLWDRLQDALEDRRRRGLLGRSVCGREGFDFDIRIHLGAGAYVCGEESALIESLEGRRGTPRDRPPFPTERGHRSEPTAVDNVETFACVTRVLGLGADWFARHGTPESTGTKLLCVSGDCPRPGVYEVPFGITVNEVLDMVGAPEAGFVQMGGPSGQCVAPKDYGRRIAFEDLATGGSVIVFGPGRDVLDVARQFADFFAHESCGWCTPCRVGTTLLRQGMERLLAGQASVGELRQLEEVAVTVARTSRCGLGQTAPNPILSTMRNFPEAYEALLRPGDFVPRLDLEAAIAPAAAIRAEARS
ncbi:NADH-ubiquinone oxidoreductase-F iron-sulfur binding region domain-containing protein [Zavarzinia sp.]|uniref:NADH-ubiquinone oxidoreductase-F iron-sulfur binding region domain-containing protein n=1 Tax=Zavarzinia sp. TaxID=2027920 RepID=UPI003563CFDA